MGESNWLEVWIGSSSPIWGFILREESQVLGILRENSRLASLPQRAPKEGHRVAGPCQVGPSKISGLVLILCSWLLL